MTMFLALAGGSSALIGGYAIFGLLRQKLSVNGATATLLCALAFGATAGAEFVREGVRKPYTVRGELYSHGLTQAETELARKEGATTGDPYPLRDAESYPNSQLRRGARVYRRLCAVCHTWNGANGLDHLAGAWSNDQRRLNIAKLQLTKPFMPPFAGDAADVEALVQLAAWRRAGEPAHFPVSEDAAVLARIAEYLQEAGVKPVLTEGAR
jgi:mono/diheme cytochrome c family protein